MFAADYNIGIKHFTFIDIRKVPRGVFKTEGVARGFQHSPRVMNDKIIFDRYYCLNSAQTKEIMVHYILQPQHNFTRVKSFMVPGGLQFPIISTCFAWHPLTSISKNRVLTARALELQY